MVSTMGNARREAKGSFFLIDAKEWKVKGIQDSFNFPLRVNDDVILKRFVERDLYEFRLRLVVPTSSQRNGPYEPYIYFHD